MKLCMPIMTETGAEARICDHFGGAPCFALYDQRDKTLETIVNSKADHEHGQCRPMDLLAGCGIEAILCKSMGKSAVAAMERQGIKVFTTKGETVRDAIDEFMAGHLVKLDPETGCKGRACH